MSQKDGVQMAKTMRAWQPEVLGEWITYQPMVRPLEEVATLFLFK